MSPDVIHRCLSARPFLPFALALTDHREFLVSSASDAELTADGMALQITSRGARVFVALNQIVTLTTESRQGSAFGFGS
jgi:hypothetical protein